ncbi:MAG: hypothetical protein KKD39_03790 [Candidatus Altiarchaeota archaeon]|nr:hypothetical protein [Candidatus Altiarchaeota archaeon]
MFVAVIEEIKYIRDIPGELTEKAIAAGELRKGAVVGLFVHPVENEKNSVLIELKLTKEGQEKAVKKGFNVPLEPVGDRYVMTDDAIEYILRMQNRQKNVETVENEENIASKPTPKAF